MEKVFLTNNVKAYFKLNWIKIALFGLICFVCLKKDLSFQFYLNSPLKVEDPVNQENDYLEPAAMKKKHKAITKKEEPTTKKQKVAKGSVGLLDKFEIPFFGNSKKKESANAEHGEIDEQTMRSYIQRFAHVAMSERKKYGIPASIILSNALFHSFAGQRDLVLNGNNHFAIPCKNWEGDRATYQGNCYRHYENAWSSFRDHSLYLSSGKYKKLKDQASAKDYKRWAHGLEKAGFSDRRNLARNLISLIEEYDLEQYDY